MKSAAAAGGFPGKLVDRPTLETCVGVAAIALSLVMAGTGDLAALRLLRRLRLRLDVAGVAGAAATAATAAAAATTGAGGAAGLSHGAHVAISMALGFLFLGGGTKTFATDDASVAALLHRDRTRGSRRTRLGPPVPPAGVPSPLRARRARAGSSAPVDAAPPKASASPRPSRCAFRARAPRATRRIEHRVAIARTPCLLPDPRGVLDLR